MRVNFVCGSETVYTNKKAEFRPVVGDFLQVGGKLYIVKAVLWSSASAGIAGSVSAMVAPWNGVRP